MAVQPTGYAVVQEGAAHTRLIKASGGRLHSIVFGDDTTLSLNSINLFDFGSLPLPSDKHAAGFIIQLRGTKIGIDLPFTKGLVAIVEAGGADVLVLFS
jgi:hypothetical protein